MRINEAVKECHKTAVEKGWWDNPRDNNTLLLLCHTELSEGAEAERSGIPPDAKDGLYEELADCCIRIFDWMGFVLFRDGVDFEAVLRKKMDFNKTRPHRHGDKEF